VAVKIYLLSLSQTRCGTMLASKPMPRTRRKVTRHSETALLVLSRRRCSLCFGLRGDLTEKMGQIAHVDRDPSNSDLVNLCYLCLPHHDDYDTQRSQSKSFTPAELRHYRDLLYVELATSAPDEGIATTLAGDAAPITNPLPSIAEFDSMGDRDLLEKARAIADRRAFQSAIANEGSRGPQSAANAVFEEAEKLVCRIRQESPQLPLQFSKIDQGTAYVVAGMLMLDLRLHVRASVEACEFETAVFGTTNTTPPFDITYFSSEHYTFFVSPACTLAWRRHEGAILEPVELARVAVGELLHIFGRQ
jgi:hypothetical protein